MSRNTDFAISEEQVYLFNQGNNYKSYYFLGAHIVESKNVIGVRFAVWAPNAKSVSVTGDFNNWDTLADPMEKIGTSGVWQVFIPNLRENELYKYAIETIDGETLFKTDPYGYYAERKPKTASIIYDLDGFSWKDQNWQQDKREGKIKNNPMIIYEVHLGSWRRKEKEHTKNYREIAEELIQYVLEMGFTHIELMPVMEHPYDGSWGYQVTGYYAPTSRYGTPEDFMYLVDRCHQEGIGVILDWVPGHFPKDAHGLARFDGTALYEHPDSRLGEHLNWGTLVFNYGRSEIRSFLISNLIFWLDKYHIDGFRVDAVASMLYLDYERKNWLPNKYGGREYIEAADLIKELNQTVASYFPNTMMIAEDSSTWGNLTKPVQYGGMGFTHKWNMGWMNDTLKYFSYDPINRKNHHNLLTFSLTYAFSERFVLPLSHDEVVHGKHSLLNKMPGDYQSKFAGLRTLFGYMMSHPGNKLLFMGGEIGHFIEWKHDDQLDWFLLEYDMHRKMKEYVKALNHFYLNNPCMWEDDNSWSGYQWISANDYNESMIAFMRKNPSGNDYIIVIINFTPVKRDQYRLGVPKEDGFEEVFNSNEDKYGGTGQKNSNIFRLEDISCHDYPHSIVIEVPPLSVVYYMPVKPNY